jgi:hypothetical protein
LWLDVDSYIKTKSSNIIIIYDWIIIGQECTLENIKKIFNNYFQFVQYLDNPLNFEQFKNLFYELTEYYRLIVIDNKNPSKILTDKIFKLQGINDLF